MKKTMNEIMNEYEAKARKREAAEREKEQNKMKKERMTMHGNTVKLGMELQFKAGVEEYHKAGYERRVLEDEKRIWGNLLEHHARTETGNAEDLDEYAQRIKSLEARITNTINKQRKLDDELKAMYEEQ